MTEASTETAEAARPTTAVARPRPPRRGPGDLSFELADDVVERLAARAPDWLAADRRAALDAFRTLPIESNRLYTPYVDLRSADLSAAAVDVAASTGRSAADLPAGTAGLAEITDGTLTALVLDDDARRQGVVLEPLETWVEADVDAARRLLVETDPLPADDKLAQLTRAAWSRGLVLRVPANVRIDRPIVLRWVLGAPDRALLTRTVVELGEGAQATLIEELVEGSNSVTVTAAGGAEGQSLFTGTLEVHLGRGADLAVASIQELGPRHVAFQHRRAFIGEAASLRWALAQLGGRLVRSRVDNRLVGDRSSVEQVEIVFGDGEQLFDLTSYTTHLGRDTTGNLLSKGALLERSRTFMKGLIIIERSAIGTDSFLGEFGMNLSKAARAVAIPSLEIDQPDCRRAAHSSSVGPIDETQLFYLESRGIGPDDARKFIVLGFLEPVVARVPLAEAQDRLRELLDRKWEAGLAHRGTGAAA